MPRHYQLNPETGVHFISDGSPFTYSDGDALEERLLHFVRMAKDHSSASAELAAGITDWPSHYHLSRHRSNLLRPLTELLGGDVLEVGAGCGALTRFLGEAARSVVAVEGSLRRAEIAAARCSGLSNVSIYCDHFGRFEVNRKFDAVACVGVIEYSPLFFSGSDPFGEMISIAADHLAPEGYLLIAIENRLGLKYFAGAPEDHTGSRFQGIEDLYAAGGPRTLGRREWERQLAACRLENIAILYPFPDYKHPQILLSDAAFADTALDVSRFIRHLSAPNQDADYERLMAEELVWPVLARNGIAADMANSFLIVARKAGATGPRWQPSALAYQYNTDRFPGDARESRISRDSSGRLFVHRRRLHPDAPANPSYSQLLTDEPIPSGVPYMEGLYFIVNRPGWTLDAIAGWAEPWYRHLCSHAATTDTSILPGELLECIPSRLMTTPDGALRPFDLEFAARAPLPVDFVLFRGLLESLSGIRTYEAPQVPVGTTCAGLAFGVMEMLRTPLKPPRREAVMRMEAEFQSSIRGTPVDLVLDRIRSASLRMRESPTVPPTDQWFESQVFWRRDGEPFTESNSCRVRSEIKQGTQRIRIEIPGRNPPPVELRLDLSDRSGVLSLLGIRVLSSECNPLWTWDHDPDAFTGRNAVLLLRTGLELEVTVIMLTADPFLLLPLPPDALTSLRDGGSIEFRIRRDDLMDVVLKVASELDGLRRS
jgi:SAM-dependent methyltransferase